MAEDYSDRPQECPRCGNPDVGHSPQADWCVTTVDPEHPEWGCGWLNVITTAGTSPPGTVTGPVGPNPEDVA